MTDQKVEQRLLQAVTAGTWVNFATGDAERDDPARGEEWPEDRIVEAALLRDLLTGYPGARAVRLSGARITGVLDLEAAVLGCPLALWSCHFEDPVNLREAQAPAIRLHHCHLPELDAEQLHTRGNLELNGLTAGPVSLHAAHIGGQLSLAGARLVNPGGTALDAQVLTVDKDMFCGRGFTAHGTVGMAGAHIGGQLDFSGAALSNPGGPALMASGLTVKGSMLCRNGLQVEGELNLLSANIQGHLDFAGAVLDNPKGAALIGSGLTVEQDMGFGTGQNGFRARGQVRLVRARIGGLLTFDQAKLSNQGDVALRADGLTVGGDLVLDAESDGEVTMNGGRVGGHLDFKTALLSNPGGGALTASGLTIERGLRCRDGFRTAGVVTLYGARVGAYVDLVGAHMTNPGGIALNAARLAVEGDLFCRDGFRAEGTVVLSGCRIGGRVSFSRAELSSPGDIALNASRLAVEGDLFCHGDFRAEGVVFLAGGRIGGQLSFDTATLNNAAGVALDFSRARAGELWLTPRNRPKGIVDLTGTQVGSFLDAPETWPDTVRLRGFAYETLGDGSVSVRTRLSWLARHEGGYTPESYDQLAGVYRRAGRVEAARRVAVAKQWHRRRELRSLGKLWNWLLYLTVGYGYRTWLAGLWLIALLAVGSAIFAHAYPDQLHAASSSVPAFQPVAYTLDALLPIIDLGQEKAWLPQGAAQVWSWVLTGSGWVLTTAVVAGLTNALKRD